MKVRRTAAPTDPASASVLAEAHATLMTTVSRGGNALDPPARAARTAAALMATDPTWNWPWWMERQLRSAHAAFTPMGAIDHVENLTGVAWTTLATAGSGPLALVDPSGAVQPIGSSWSLDWAIGADDRWHRPAAETTVRQRLVSQSPVVETVCKVPSGEAVARVYAIASSGSAGDAVVFEIENESPVPFVAVFAVRPTHPLGVGCVSSVRYEHPHVLVDDRPAIVFDKRAARWSTADAPGDALHEAFAGLARDDDFEPVHSAYGLATACFLVPVPHRRSVRAVLFPRSTRRDRPAAVSSVPTAGQVARGWEVHAGRAARVELPDRRVTDAYAAAVRALAAASGGGLAVPVGREANWSIVDEAAIVATLASIGMHELAGDLLRRRCDEFELDSWFRREPASIGRNTAVFDAVGRTYRAGRDRTLIGDVLGAVVKAAHWTERARSRESATIPPQLAQEAATSLADVAHALRACDQPDAADDLDAFAARFVLDVSSPDDTAEPDPDVTVPLAVQTIHGLDVAATVHAARADIVNRDPFAFERLEWILRLGGPVMHRPTYAHPRLLTGCGGSGDDPVVAAAFVRLVRSLVIDEDARANTLMLLPMVPPTWFGQSLDVHDLPTRYGTMSFALRWHASRPALLWELTPNDHVVLEPLTIIAPGLDPSWLSTEPRGEALLAAPTRNATTTMVEQPATDHVPMTTLEPRRRREPDAQGPVRSDESTTSLPAEPGGSFG